MCGINLIYDKTSLLGNNNIIPMNKATVHRGPDFRDFTTIQEMDFQIFLGVNRLKILDMNDHANQPFVSTDGLHVLAYNGEIYNFYDLKNKLIKKGIQFSTGSDTEVLLSLLRLEGEAALPQLEGMFAFFYYNAEKQVLLIARDRHGMKPLYYYEDDKYLIASSEIKGLFSSGLINKELNEQQVDYYLRYRYAQKPQTFFKNIYELEEGLFLQKSLNKASEIKLWNNPSFNNFTTEIPDTDVALLQKSEELLKDSALKHLIADVPYGLFLSGGVDSTLLLALLKDSGKSLPCFSIVNSAKEAPFGTEDYLYAKKASRQFGAYHDQIEVGSDVLGKFCEFLDSMDQPIGDSGAFLTYLLAEHSQHKVKVVLSGAGADEVFAGYNRHSAYFTYLQHRGKIDVLKPVLKGLANLVPKGIHHPFRKKAQLLTKFTRNLSADPFKTFINFTTLNIERNRENEATTDHTFQQNNSQLLRAALKYDRENYLISDVLAISDQFSMRQGLEMRMPYLDNNVTDFMDSLPPEILLKHGRKWILQDILKKHGGKIYTRRKKEGFGLPFGHWVQQGKTEKLLAIFNEGNRIIFNFVPEARVEKIIHAHMKHQADNSLEIWALTVLAFWLEKEFGNRECP